MISTSFLLLKHRHPVQLHFFFFFESFSTFGAVYTSPFLPTRLLSFESDHKWQLYYNKDIKGPLKAPGFSHRLVPGRSQYRKAHFTHTHTHSHDFPLIKPWNSSGGHERDPRIACFPVADQEGGDSMRQPHRGHPQAWRDENQLFGPLASLPDNFEARDLGVNPLTKWF